MVTKYINSKQIVGRADFSDQFRKIIVRYKRIGYNINIMQPSACSVFNPVNNFASLFNCIGEIIVRRLSSVVVHTL